jgi:hypothetical protein
LPHLRHHAHECTSIHWKAAAGGKSGIHVLRIQILQLLHAPMRLSDEKQLSQPAHTAVIQIPDARAYL